MDQLSHDSFNFEGVTANRVREGGRDSLLLAALIRVGDATQPRKVRIRNLSRGGLMAEFGGRAAIGDPVEVQVHGIGWVRGRIAWIAEGRIGVAFEDTVDPAKAR